MLFIQKIYIYRIICIAVNIKKNMKFQHIDRFIDNIDQAIVIN